MKTKPRKIIKAGKKRVALGLLCLFAGAAATQDAAINNLPPVLDAGTVPEALRVPQRGEAPRYPRDTVIGVLGPGDAPDEAYRFARSALNGVLAKDPESQGLNRMEHGFIENLFAALEQVSPRKFRVGGGREEPDGSVSFLVRFAGRDQWIAGELYLRFEEEQWRLDDLMLEDPHNNGDASSYGFDFSPYERFF